MGNLLALISIGCFFGAFIVFLQSMDNAFKKSFVWGWVILLFPVGSYFYYKKFFSEEKPNVVKLIVCLSIGLISFIISKF